MKKPHDFSFLNDVSHMILLLIVLTDEEFRQLTGGNPEIFKKVYLHHKKDIYNFLLLKCRGNTDRTEDIFSETIISALKSVSLLKNQDNFQSWLVKIAHRRYSDHMRRIFREKSHVTHINENQDFVAADSRDIVDELADREKVVLLNMALENINSGHREIIERKIFKRQKVKDIAAAFSRSEKAVESMLSRARSALKKEMNKLRTYF
jgi:RNA polymerase sigma-70 factor, ECF subfamily